MFKNFNHKFVYKHPLLWNTKIVPFLLISLALHLLFFIVGYQNAIVSSVQFHSFNIQESNANTINLFGILISVLVFIIWCVLYFRNNAFKAFYPKKNDSLFKEWMLIVLFCFLNFSYVISALFGANVQTRSVISQELAMERCEIIGKASIFIQGSYNEGTWMDSTVNGEYIRIERDSFPFEGKKYALKSLMNKNMERIPFFNSKEDSLAELQVKRWMKSNNKEEIAKIFKSYLSIGKEHQIKSNISPEEWLELVYDYPEFTNYKTIGRIERELQYEYGYEETEIALTTEEAENSFARDTISTTIKKLNGQTYIFSKYYVSHKPLSEYYEKVAEAWQNPLVDLDYLTIVLYFSFGGSLLVYSFKVTSAKSWLIALIAMGVLQIIFGIGAVFFNYSMTYPTLYLIYFLALCIYFIMIYRRKKGKQFSGIVLNQILWLMPAVLPFLYVMIMDFVKKASGYYERYDRVTRVLIEEFPKIDWFEEHSVLLIQLNLVILAFILFLLSRVIKKWRGISEE